MNATETKILALKCKLCDVLISQADADMAADMVGEGHETMCPACAESICNAHHD